LKGDNKMSRTQKSSKGVGYDFWSRRCFGSGCMGFGKVAKGITKRKERTRDKVMVRKALINHEDFESRFPGE